MKTTKIFKNEWPYFKIKPTLLWNKYERWRKVSDILKVSKMAEVAYNTIVKIESGENPNPTIETLFKIAKALNTDINNLIK